MDELDKGLSSADVNLLRRDYWKARQEATQLKESLRIVGEDRDRFRRELENARILTTLQSREIERLREELERIKGKRRSARNTT